MGKFSRFVKAPHVEALEEPEFMRVEGSFGCQICFEQVDEAKYFQVDKLIIWKCSQNHKSYIEDFNL